MIDPCVLRPFDLWFEPTLADRHGVTTDIEDRNIQYGSPGWNDGVTVKLEVPHLYRKP